MADILHAMSISGAILLAVVGLIILMSFAAVKRGEIAMHGEPEAKGWWNFSFTKPVSGAIAARPATASDISVMQILLVGTGLFVVAVLFLFIISVLGHL